MSRRSYTDHQRADALQPYVEHGLGQAARLSGVPRGALSSWTVPVQECRQMQRALHVRARGPRLRARLAEVTQGKREELAGRLLAEVHTLLDQVQKPTTHHHVVTLSGGKDSPASAAVVLVDLPHPLVKDQQAGVAAVPALVEKLQLLSGEATERHGLTAIPFS